MNTLRSLISLLKDKNLTIATAESCSSGYLSYLLTKTPGSSQIFKGGFIVYSLESKTKLFNISISQLKKTQGVSKEIAQTLAEKTRIKLSADIGLAIVGFAGPTAQAPKKKGLVYISLADRKGSLTKKLQLTGNRDQIRIQAVHKLLDLLYSKINNY